MGTKSWSRRVDGAKHQLTQLLSENVVRSDANHSGFTLQSSYSHSPSGRSEPQVILRSHAKPMAYVHTQSDYPLPPVPTPLSRPSPRPPVGSVPGPREPERFPSECHPLSSLAHAVSDPNLRDIDDLDLPITQCHDPKCNHVAYPFTTEGMWSRGRRHFVSQGRVVGIFSEWYVCLLRGLMIPGLTAIYRQEARASKPKLMPPSDFLLCFRISELLVLFRFYPIRLSYISLC